MLINTTKINNNCLVHNKSKTIAFCFECNSHLCDKCLNSRNHVFHKKNLITEIKPSDEEISTVQKIINKYKSLKNNLVKQKKETKKRQKKKLTHEKKNYMKIIKKILNSLTLIKSKKSER